MRYRMLVLLTMALALATSTVAALAQELRQYTTPVVFQRFLSDAATPDVPGFYGGASIWIMEADGSHVSLLRDPGQGDSARHLDHPSVASDGTYVVYAEFENAALGARGSAKLYKEDLRTRERFVMRELEGCALHHATLSLDDRGLTYARDCGEERTMVTELFGKTLQVKPQAAAAFIGNGVSAGNRVVYQQELRSPKAPAAQTQTARTIGIVVTAFTSARERTDRVVADAQHRNRRPAISADGRYVAWQSNAATGGESDDLLLLDLATPGATPERLTASPANDGHPWFSRDGLWLLFESDRSSNWEIYKMHLPSREVTQLTNDTRYVSTRPRW